jgi:hypothetical protein
VKKSFKLSELQDDDLGLSHNERSIGASDAFNVVVCGSTGLEYSFWS